VAAATNARVRRMSAPMAHVVVLDDDELVGASIGMVAEDAGFVATVTSSFDAFWAAVRDHRPSHVTLDLHMPEVDGVEVLRRLAAAGFRGSVIVTSGLDRRVLEAARLSVLEHGLYLAGVLPKPFDPGDLRALLSGTPSTRAPRPAAAAVPDALALRRALADDLVSVAYQPKVRCSDGAVVGFEALARWHDPELGHVRPDVFVRVAEQEGLIGALTDAVFARALEWLRAHDPHGATHLSLNLSARSLGGFEVLGVVDALCARFGVPPQRLVLELTETASLDDEVLALDVLTRLRIKGCALAIDDFGTGHSTLVQLARQPFSELKIDKRFVGSLAHVPESRTIVRAMIGLAHGLGLTATAEGVEDVATFRYLVDEGCDHAQGYYLGRPMPGEEIPAWLGAMRS
jgi:EAL domain-containing protein (putative c-di-GMP-specific phosphodiesterase class I)/ActR/RegA family two-component response regulator